MEYPKALFRHDDWIIVHDADEEARAREDGWTDFEPVTSNSPPTKLAARVNGKPRNKGE